MLAEESIFSDLKKIMAELLKRDLAEIENLATTASNLRDDLGIDSVESLDFLYALENQYSVEIRDNEVEAIKTVRDVIDLIVKKVNGKKLSEEK